MTLKEKLATFAKNFKEAVRDKDDDLYGTSMPESTDYKKKIAINPRTGDFWHQKQRDNILDVATRRKNRSIPKLIGKKPTKKQVRFQKLSEKLDKLYKAEPSRKTHGKNYKRFDDMEKGWQHAFKTARKKGGAVWNAQKEEFVNRDPTWTPPERIIVERKVKPQVMFVNVKSKPIIIRQPKPIVVKRAPINVWKDTKRNQRSPFAFPKPAPVKKAPIAKLFEPKPERREAPRPERKKIDWSKAKSAAGAAGGALKSLFNSLNSGLRAPAPKPYSLHVKSQIKPIAKSYTMKSTYGAGSASSLNIKDVTPPKKSPLLLGWKK